jgi:hypothetical protein
MNTPCISLVLSDTLSDRSVHMSPFPDPWPNVKLWLMLKHLIEGRRVEPRERMKYVVDRPLLVTNSRRECELGNRTIAIILFAWVIEWT